MALPVDGIQSAPSPVLVIFGPTACGKTALLERLFTGPKALCRAQVVSADSMQVYRGMDIGTAKPSAALNSRLKHHLIDIYDPDRQFNAGEFVDRALCACAQISGEGCLPVVCGGAGFYLNNLILGLPEAPPSDEAVRAAVRAELAGKGAQALFAMLREGDPESAGRIHPNDTYRLTRALEVLRLTGRPLSSFKRNGRHHAAGIRFILVGLERERDELYRRIDERCRAMFADGLAR
jgi:tRNA dimethylallyltransferase